MSAVKNNSQTDLMNKKGLDDQQVAIHATRSIAPYRTGKYVFTRSKDNTKA